MVARCTVTEVNHAGLRGAIGTRIDLGHPYFSITYVPGASSRGGCFALPIGGGAPFRPDRAESHAVQSGHQLPS
jgi:hypothetical protein